jgi:hypothetical protein
MLKNFKLLLACVIASSFFNAQAQDTIELGYPAYGGNGCPAGTASATLSPDGSSLSIIFDEFITEAGPAAGKTINRKSCNIAVPVHVPNGYSISVLAVDYRGYVGLPRSASARLQAEYFFAGMRGPRFSRDFIGATDRDYTFSNELGVESMVWSPCGADVNLRVNASMMVRNTNRSLDAIATVDSADINAGMIYHIQTRRCR